jgi:hypothetical protein
MGQTKINRVGGPAVRAVMAGVSGPRVNQWPMRWMPAAPGPMLLASNKENVASSSCGRDSGISMPT